MNATKTSRLAQTRTVMGESLYWQGGRAGRCLDVWMEWNGTVVISWDGTVSWI